MQTHECPICGREISDKKGVCKCGFFMDITIEDPVRKKIEIKKALKRMITVHNSKRLLYWGIFWIISGLLFLGIIFLLPVIPKEEVFLYYYMGYVIILYGIYETYISLSIIHKAKKENAKSPIKIMH